MEMNDEDMKSNAPRPSLIAGAGPAGLTAAIALARQGIESLSWSANETSPSFRARP